jgi:predicted N-acetyltransferase YhbS
MNLRLMTPADISEGMRLKDIAGWNQTPADWERFLQASPQGCFVVETEGRVVGTVTTIVYEGRFAWIGMVLVDPGWRGQGIGTRLLEKAIEHLEACGVPTMKLDATPEGRPIYEKLGFLSEYQIERWKLNRSASQRSAQAGAHPSLEEVLQLDREVFGADRSDLLRSLASAAPDLTLVLAERGEVFGYAFGRRGARADHFGPWVARNQSSACQLLEEFLCRSTREMIFVDSAKSNPWSLPLLRGHGFGFSRPFTRMYRGCNTVPGRPELLCAILGPEFG